MEFYIQDGFSNIQAVAELFVEYAQSLGFSLDSQDFAAELRGLDDKYGPPLGRLCLAVVGGRPAGCAALRPLENAPAHAPGKTCEMKRLYVRPAYRKMGLGFALCRRLIEDARAIGYKRMVLDTLSHMDSALKLYERLGFSRIPPYYDNPLSDAVYLAIDLD